MNDGASIAVGLLIVFVAGCLNGSWNASFSPKLGLAVGSKTSTVEVRAVGRRATIIRRLSSAMFSSSSSSPAEARTAPQIDLDYHFSWVLFQLFASVINIPLCLYWVGGPERASWIVSQATTLDMFLIVLFSLLWGIGSVGFGLACKIAGVGLGTNLIMGVIMILGTLVPLLLEGQAATAAGGLILGGLTVCSFGLAFSVKSLSTRDLDEAEAAKTNTVEVAAVKDDDEQEEAVAATNDDENKEPAEIEANVETEASEPNSEERTYSTLYKVAICVVAGLFATQLQFAFVFGENLIDLAESSDGPGKTPSSGAASIIWLFAIPVSAPVSIIYGFYSSPKHIPISTMWRSPWYRYVIILLTTSVPWVCHIHLYGYANSILPEDIAASVAWPVLMMVTVTAGLVWSLILGEWKQASKLAMRQLYVGIAIVSAGVILLMASAALS